MVASASDSHEVFVLTNNFDLKPGVSLVSDGNKWITRSNYQVMYQDPSRVAVLRSIKRAFDVRPDVIYVNSLFSFSSSIVFQIVARMTRHVQLVLAPRGELDPGALNIRSEKKRRYLEIVRRSHLLDNVVWHASSELEANNIRHQFPRANVLVKENDTLLPLTADTSSVRMPDQDEATPLSSVFLSRIAPKKGLHVALEALRESREGIRLDVLGPEEDAEYAALCRQLAKSLPSNVSVNFLGPIKPDQTRIQLAKYDLMIFPTAGENFGHVIAESLSVGCPVMCTPETPWTALLESQGGVVVPSQDPEAWGEAIDAYSALPKNQLRINRMRAADAYNSWRNENKGMHFFDLAEMSIK